MNATVALPPPGLGLDTVIWAGDRKLKSASSTAIKMTEGVTDVFDFSRPFHCTTECARKPEPLIVSGNLLPPASALDGDMESIFGAG